MYSLKEIPISFIQFALSLLESEIVLVATNVQVRGKNKNMKKKKEDI